MTDIRIRTVPHHVIATIDELADAAGLSRQEYRPRLSHAPGPCWPGRSSCPFIDRCEHA